MNKILLMLIVIFSVFSYPSVFALSNYDLNISIESNQTFVIDISNTYKLIVMNNETAEDYINFTLQYYITQNNEFVSGFPKETSNELKKQKTISRSWTPKNSGQFSICCKILNSTIRDDNPANDLACKDIFIEGDETITINETTVNDSNNITLTTIIDNPSNSLPTDQINNAISNISSNSLVDNISVKNSSSKNSVNNASSNKSVSSSSDISQNTSSNSQDAGKKETNGITGKVIYESKGEKMKILSMELLLFLLIIVIIYSIIRTKLK